jgi:nucleoside-diphosphate-sugar epimerase
MKVLLTGGTGFLGSHVAEALVKEGHHVRALVRRTSNKAFLQSLGSLVELAEGSVEDRDAVAAAVDGVEAVIHSAGLVKARSIDEFFLTNVTGTANLVEASRRSGKIRRFVFVSSQAAIGPSPDGQPVSVLDPPGPVTHYGRSKLAAEGIALAAKDDLHVVVIRPPLIYGPRDNETFAFFQSVSRGVLPMLGDGTNTLSVVYASDAASGCVRAMTANVPSGSAYFVDDGDVYVWKDALSHIERAVGRRAFVRFGLPIGVVNVAALFSEAYGRFASKAVMLTRDKVNELRQKHWVVSSDETRKELGWSPEVKWPEGTLLAAEWYRTNGWL